MKQFRSRELQTGKKMELIDTLREQHWKIRSLCKVLSEFCGQGITASDLSLEGFVIKRGNLVVHLQSFKNILLAHLKLEDSKFYPPLLKSKDKQIKKITGKYLDEMKLISKRTFSFFETYEHLKTDDLARNDSFRLDLSTVTTIITRRIDLEEVELYPLYSKVKQK